MTTFLLSYPSKSWRIIGAKNPHSEERPQTSAKQAKIEWVRVADALVGAGAEVVVLPPPEIEPPMTGLLYTANAGQLFDRFRLSQMTAAHRREESAVLSQFLEGLGIETERAEHPWEGQAEIITDGSGRYLLTWGVRSSPESVEEVQAALPQGSSSLGVRIRPPFYHGDTCLGFFQNSAGRSVLLVYLGALLDKTREELESFVGPDTEVYPILEQDALLYACNSVCINGTLLHPKGLSQGLLSALQQRGFRLVEVPLDELCGKGGGGPRALVNRLGDISVPSELRYQALRAKIIHE